MVGTKDTEIPHGSCWLEQLITLSSHNLLNAVNLKRTDYSKQLGFIECISIDYWGTDKNVVTED